DKMIRERGKQLLEMGLTFIKNRDILTAPENKELFNKFMQTVKTLSDEKTKFTAELANKVSGQITTLKKDIEAKVQAIAEARKKLAENLERGIAYIDKVTAKLTAAELGKLPKEVQDLQKKFEELLGNKALSAGIADLRRAMDDLRKRLLD